MRHFLVICITIYLATQLAVNSSIIDLVAPQIDAPSLDQTREVAEVMAGFGVALFLVNLIYAGRLRTADSLTKLNILKRIGVIFAVCSLTITPLLRFFMASYVDATSASERRDFVALSAGAFGLSFGSYRITSFGIDLHKGEDVSIKSAILLFVPLAITTDIINVVHKDAPVIVASALFQNRERIRQKFESDLKPYCNDFNRQYADYKKKTEQFMGKFYEDIGRKRFRELRDQELGYKGSIEPALPRMDFLREPDVQAYMRRLVFTKVAEFPLSPQITHIVSKHQLIEFMDTMFARKVLDPCIHWTQFDNEFIGPLIRRAKLKVAEVLTDEYLSDLDKDDDAQLFGQQAVYAALVPSITMSMTLLSSFLGVAALLSLFLRAYLGAIPAVTYSCVILVIAAILFVPLHIPSRIADTPAFRKVAEEAIKNGNWQQAAMMHVVEWVLRTAPLVYPVGSFLRDHGPGVPLGLARKNPPSVTVANKIPPVDDKLLFTNPELKKFVAEGIIPKYPALSPKAPVSYPTLGIAYTHQKQLFLAYDRDPNTATKRAQKYCVEATGDKARCTTFPSATPADRKKCVSLYFTSSVNDDDDWIRPTHTNKDHNIPNPKEIYQKSQAFCASNTPKRFRYECDNLIEITCNYNNFHRIYRLNALPKVTSDNK